ncbi:MAG: Hsp20/alpha crystallin family protein [Deltaproteobacteria bacterium]|nr:Hsp20/alpha crystallin family protein [Deltaproteobacteria bacterium]
MPVRKKKPGKKEEAGFVPGFGGFFKNLGGIIEFIAEAAEKGGVARVGELKGLGKEAKGVYGFSIRTLAGEPVIESFGNIRETPRGPVVEEVREPLVDVFDEKDELRIIAEMPGIEKEDIKAGFEGDALELKAEGKDRKYSRRIKLAAPVDPSTVTISYKNGIVEIKVKKAI